MEEREKKILIAIPAISEILKIRKTNPIIDEERIIGEFARSLWKVKEPSAKLIMLATASRTVKIIEKNPRMNDKEIMGRALKEISFIIEEIESEIMTD